MTDLLVALASAVGGFLLALKLVGYGVRHGLRQVGILWRYRTGRCRCAFCRDL